MDEKKQDEMTEYELIEYTFNAMIGSMVSMKHDIEQMIEAAVSFRDGTLNIVANENGSAATDDAQTTDEN